MYSFKVYSKTDLMSEVFVDGQVVTFKNYSSRVIFLPFWGKRESNL